MKYLTIIFISFILRVDSAKKEYNFFPNLPVGEYKLFVKGLVKCDTNSPNNNFIPNIFLYKTSANTTDVKGNLTVKKPFDDSYSFDINLAIKDSIGGWKDNAYVYKSPKACSTCKNFLGSEWSPLLETMGILDSKCPVSPGVYVLSGNNLSNIIARANYPTQFFYGTYKARISFIDSANVKHGCVVFVVEVKRPWETE